MNKLAGFNIVGPMSNLAIWIGATSRGDQPVCINPINSLQLDSLM